MNVAGLLPFRVLPRNVPKEAILSISSKIGGAWQTLNEWGKRLRLILASVVA